MIAIVVLYSGAANAQDKSTHIQSSNEFALDLNLIKRSAEKGYSSAQFQLGTLYRDGTGLKRDLKKARFWFEKSADQDYIPAQIRLGLMYKKGLGGEKHIKKAHYWFKRAAALGDVEALVYLGDLISEFQNLDIFGPSASDYYLAAAKRDHTGAQNKIGTILLNGTEGDKNLSLIHISEPTRRS